MAHPVEHAVISISSKYTVSSDGRVFSTTAGRVMKQRINSAGYAVVTLKINSKSVTRSVHQLVLLAFVGGPPNDGHKYSCDHRNRVRKDNRLLNLRWATASEQVQNSSVCLETTSRPASYRPIIATSCTGEMTSFPRIADALSTIAPLVNPKSSHRFVYKVLGSEKMAYGHTWEYAPPPAGLFKLILKL